MTLLAPVYLLLLIPLVFAWRLWTPPPGWRRWLRSALLLALVVALCRPALLLPRRGGTVVAVVDRSASMPAESVSRAGEILHGLDAARGSEDRVGVVSFGARAAVEQPPAAGVPQDLVAAVGGDRSNLAEALDTALTLLPKDGSGRLLVLSDGRWTGRDPASAATRAALASVPVDYRLLERSAAGDVAVERLDVPQEVTPGEGFLISAWLRSPVSRDAEVELRRGDRVVARVERRLNAGRTRVSFRDRAPPSGVRDYSVAVRPAGDPAVPDAADPLPENNVASFLVGVRGPKPIAVVSHGSILAESLRRGGLDVTALAPRELHGTLEQLAGFSAVVLENVPASDLGQAVLDNLAVWTRAGGGLVMTGGESSFGPGGYFRSPLEDVLPVTMELRQEHRKMALAMVVALDRSGSMAAAVPGGRTKMDLANLATVSTLDLLSPIDEMAVIAVDSAPHIVVPLQLVENAAGIRNAILGIDSLGGGIFVYEALHASVAQLLKSEAGTRHVLLFADAADAENPAQYKGLLEQARAAAITVSVVGLGKPDDVDADFLRDVAARGGGRIFFTESAQALPRLFAQDAFVVARSSFVEEPTALRTTVALTSLTGRSFGVPPPVGGYNLTYLRPGAQLLAVSEDDYEAPVAAAWQAELGRAVVYTGEVAGKWSGEIAAWEDFGSLLASLARYAAGSATGLPREMMVTQELERGVLRVRLHLDPERSGDPFAVLPQVQVLRGTPGAPPERQAAALSWTDPDTLIAEVELRGAEVAVARLEVPNVGAADLLPVRLPYGPELAPAEAGAGRRALERIARATGGRQRLDVSDAWRGFPRRPRRVELTPWLFAAVLVLLLAEILERRTALLSSGSWRLSGRWTSRPWRWPRLRWPRQRRPDKAADEPPPGLVEVDAAQVESVLGPADEGKDNVLAALGKARQRADRRTRR